MSKKQYIHPPVTSSPSRALPQALKPSEDNKQRASQVSTASPTTKLSRTSTGPLGLPCLASAADACACSFSVSAQLAAQHMRDSCSRPVATSFDIMLFFVLRFASLDGSFGFSVSTHVSYVKWLRFVSLSRM